MKKKLLKACVMLILGICVLAGTIPALADGGNMAIDLVVVIDQSISMNGTSTRNDQKGYRLDATQIILSMLDKEKSQGGVVMFAGATLPIDGKEKYSPDWMTKLNNHLLSIWDRTELIKGIENDRDALNRKDGDLPGYLYGNTDFGTALEEAIEIILKESKSGNNKVILLLTDGELDFGTTDPTEYNRLMKKAEDNIKKAIEEAREYGIKIYTAFLKGSANAKDPVHLHTIADETEGEFWSVATADELPEIFNDIFATQIGSHLERVGSEKILPDTERGTGYQKIEIEVLNRSVKEINLVVPVEKTYGADTRDQFQIYDPNGNLVKDSNTLIVTKTKYFLAYKIINPMPTTDKPGKWRLSFPESMKGAFRTYVQYVFSYNVDTRIDLSATTQAKQEDLTIDVFFTEDGVKSSDTTLYTSINANMIVYKIEGDKMVQVVPDKDKISLCSNMETNIPKYTEKLNMKEILGEWYGKGVYQIEVSFSGAGMERKSLSETFELTNDPPRIVKNLSALEFFFNDHNGRPDTGEQRVNLKDYVEDPNGDEITFELITPIPSDLDVDWGNKKNGELIVRQKQIATSRTIKIRVIDSDGESIDVELHVNVSDNDNQYHDYGISLTIDGAQYENGGYLLKKGEEYILRVTPTKAGVNTMDELYLLEVKIGDDVIWMARQKNGSYIGTFTAANTKVQYQIGAYARFGSESAGTAKTAILIANVENHAPTLSDVSFTAQLASQLKMRNGGGVIATILGTPEGNVFWTEKMLLDTPTEEISFDVSEFFKDEDGSADPLTYRAVMNGVDIPLVREDNEYKLKVSEDNLPWTDHYTYNITIYCRDSDGAEVHTEGSFQAISLQKREIGNLKTIGIGAGIAFVLFLIIRYLCKPAFGRDLKLGLYQNTVELADLGGFPDRAFARKRKCSLERFYDAQIGQMTDGEIGPDDMKCVDVYPAGKERVKIRLCKEPPEEMLLTVSGVTLDWANKKERRQDMYEGDELMIMKNDQEIELKLELRQTETETDSEEDPQ